MLQFIVTTDSRENKVSGNIFTIGNLSKYTGVKVETIRYYEKIGLLPTPRRSEGGYRLYDRVLQDRLAFVKRGRELGFSLEDVRALLKMDEGAGACGDVRAMTLQHLGTIKSKIADLRKLERTLSKVAAQCEGGSAPDCPIIEAISGKTPPD